MQFVGVFAVTFTGPVKWENQKEETSDKLNCHYQTKEIPLFNEVKFLVWTVNQADFLSGSPWNRFQEIPD